MYDACCCRLLSFALPLPAPHTFRTLFALSTRALMVCSNKRAGDKRSSMSVFERETRALDCFKTVIITHQKITMALATISPRM